MRNSSKMRKMTYVKIVIWITKAWESVKVSVVILGFREEQIISPKNDISFVVNSDSSDTECDYLLNTTLVNS